MTNLEVRPPEQDCSRVDHGPGTVLVEGRDVPLGGVRQITVNRTLPSRELPTIGAWCFLDRFGPAAPDAMVVLPHPHTALQTVTWPLSGSVHHRDTIGSDVIVRPGELNLMTAGHGVAHSEVSLNGPDPLSGLQLWVALPDGALDEQPSFEQHRELPRADLGALTATVLVGELAGTRSPATHYTPLLGAQLESRAGTTLIELAPGFEHGLMLLDGRVTVDGHELAPGPLLYLGPGRTGVELHADGPAKMILLGGEPFTSELIMWWNFIGRSHDDIVLARQQWEDHAERFGPQPGRDDVLAAAHGDSRIPAPPMPATVLKPRRRRHRGGR